MHNPKETPLVISNLRAPGKIAVSPVVCTHDCALVVNSDGLRNQIEGCVVQTLTRTLHEGTTFERTRVTGLDWVSRPTLAFPEAPAIEVVLLDRPAGPMMGAGEAARRPLPRRLAP